MLDKKLEYILNDSTSGSTEILQALIKFFISHPENLNEVQLKHLRNHFRTFQIIKNFLTELQKYISSKGKGEITDYLKSYLSDTENNLNLIFQNALPYLESKQNIVTISNSKTLLYVLTEYYKIETNLNVTILESRPMFEGRILAEELSKHGIKTNLITEAMTANAVEHSDAVIIGADNILSNGDVINKTGSRNLAIICKYFSKPFYVIADKTKFSMNNKFEKSYQDTKEIWKFPPDKIKIENYYFEKIEAELISKIIHN